MKLEIPSDVVLLCKRLRDENFEAFVVGGAVRDLLRGAQAKDFDVATSAHPADVKRVFGRKLTIPTGEQHGTVTVLTGRQNPATGEREKQHVEVTTYRVEGIYGDGRRPEAVAFVRSLDEDLKRRDFTINAIAYDPLGDELRDPFGGQRDLAARLIRAVGDPLERFREDGLRAMRAVRFAAQLEFTIDPPTEQAIGQALEVFRKVSAERVRDELVKILGARKPSIGLQLMQTTRLLDDVIPELRESVGVHQNRFHKHDVWHHTLAAVDATALGPTTTNDPPWLVRFAALLHDVAKPRTAAPKEDSPAENTFYRHEQVGADMADVICRRLKLANAERDTIVNLVGNHMFWYTPEWTDGTVRRFISRVGVEHLDGLFALRAGDVRARGQGEEPGVEIDELRARIDAEIAKASALKITDLAVGGADVMEVLGCRPGPIIGEVLRALLERVLDDAALNDRDKLRALIPDVAKSAPAPKP